MNGFIEFIQRQNQWFQYGDRVWVNHIDYVTQCTSFSLSTIDVTDCNQKNAFICEIDPKISIDPMSWRGDMLAVAFIGVLAATVLLVGAALVCWYSKSKHRHLQRLERRNSIRQSLHSVRSIGSINGLSDTAYRRKLAQMSARSTDTLTKGSDYRKMLASTTSMESMEKSQFNSSLEDTQSFDIYEAHNPNANVMPLKHSTFMKKPASPEYSIPQNNNRPYENTRPFDIAFRNEGYRDNSAPASEAPSVTTEEMPIIHHPGGMTSPEDILSPNSDQYYTSDTLPLRGQGSDRGEGRGFGPKLSFLMELRSRMPEPPPPAAPPTTFGQRANIADQQQYFEDNLPSPPMYQYDNTLSENIPSYDSSPHDLSREFDTPTPDLHHRSKSEALLETNFDFDDSEPSPLPMSEAHRSHSQPLETAM